MRDRLWRSVAWLGLALLLSVALAGWLAGRDGRASLVFALVAAAVLYLWSLGLRRVLWALGLRRACLAFPPGGETGGGLRRRRYLHLASLAGLVAGIGLCAWFLLWALRPELLPQRACYDFIANRHVTERLVDPALLKVERWEVLGQEREVLFVHPAPSGSTALVYPVRVEPRTTLRADLAVAPEAWAVDGDGVTFSVYAEDDAGTHLLYSRYVDPKHHQQDRRWLPLRVNLSPLGGKLVRIILVVGSGPAGDRSYDWAGWGEPRLERPVWP